MFSLLRFMDGGCRGHCVSVWSLSCPDLEAENAEDRRMVLVLITKSRHSSSATTKKAGGLVFNELHRHSLKEG